MISVRPISAALSVLLLIPLAACGASSAIERSREFARLGDYQHAFEVLDIERDRQLENGEVDEALAREHELARRQFLLKRAQWRIFGEQEDLAMRDLDRLAEVDPDYPGLADLREMALKKQAGRIVERADELLAQKDYVGAMEGYLESRRVVPDFEPAQKGIEAVRAELDRMSARARQQFLQAVRKVPEFRHVEVAWHAQSVIEHTPDPSDEQRETAARLREEARHESARDMMRRAEECERADKFGAALLLYRDARRLDPEVEGAEEAIARMERELKALGMLERAQLELRSENFAVARELLDEALKLSTLSRGMITELLLQTRKREGQRAYQDARDLQVMGKKAEALAAFEQVVAGWPEGIDDEAARIESLKVDIAGAEEEWAAAEEAEAAGRLEEALDHYINAERYYAEWRDGEQHIARLRKLIAEKGGAEPEKPPAGGGGSDS